MTSRQKLLGLLTAIEAIEPDAVAPQAQAVLLMLTVARPNLTAMIPENPAQLDDYLLLGAFGFLRMRSDDAMAFRIVDADGNPLPEPTLPGVAPVS